MKDSELVQKLAWHRREYFRLLAQAVSQGLIPASELEAGIGGGQLYQLVTELDEANKRLSEQVMTDALTGIGNRRLFNNRLSELIAEAERGRPLSVMMIDIDNFKSYNDLYGHQAGDTVLVQVADTMCSQIRKVDCLARYGGEEFSLATATIPPGTLTLAEKLRTSVSKITNSYRQLTVSIGVTKYRSGDTMDSIVGRADEALYVAKRSGRDRVTLLEIND